jgi:two-component system, cell cycle sensor histidine kinase and response regulator CckA
MNPIKAMLTKAVKGRLFRDLMQHEEGLQRTIGDLEKRAAESSRKLLLGEIKYQSLFGNIHTAVVVHGPDSRILMSNSMAHELLGLTEEQLVGKSAMDPDWHFFREDGSVLPPEEYPANRVLFTGKPLRDSVTGIHRGSMKEDVWCLVNADPVLDEHGVFAQVVVTFVDITEHRRHDAVNVSSLRLIQFAATHSLDELLEETLNEAEKLSGSLIGFYHFVDDDQESLTLQNWSTRTKSEFCKAEGKGLHYPVKNAGVWVECVYLRTPVIHNDYASLPNRKGMPEGHAAVIRELVVPVMRGEKIKAILGVGNKAADYDEKDVYAISLLADLAWEIAERKQAEEVLQTSELRYRMAQTMGHVGNWEYNIQTKEFWGSDETKRIYGFDPAQQIFSTDEVESCILERDRVRQALADLIESGKEYNMEFEIQPGNSSQPRFISSVAELQRDNNGNPLKIAGVIHDITARKRAEMELRRSENRKSILNQIANIFLSSPDEDVFAEVLSVVRHTLDSPYGIFGFIAANGDLIIPSLTKEVWDKCRVPGKAIVFPSESWGHSLWGESIREKKLLSSEGKFHTPEGHIQIERFISAPVVYQDKTIGLISLANKESSYTQEEMDILEDITVYVAPILNARRQRDQREQQRKQAEQEKQTLEEQLRHVQKLESIGNFASGIAHDFNNILNVITGYGSIMQMKSGPDDLNKVYIREILAATDRASQLTRSLLIFSRKQIAEQKPVSVNDLIKGMQKMISRIIGEDIEMHMEIAPENLVVLGDQGQLEQVVMNLVTNARDAMHAGGTLIIKTGIQEINAAFNRSRGFGKPGRYALITFTDSGCGMDEETREKIFEPFFTTKEIGKGTGLGLSIVYGIVKQHNGYIDCYIEQGKGTTFEVYLPVVDLVLDETDKLPEIVSQGGSETILLAEDDAPSRNLTKDLLERFGYSVIDAVDGVDAVNKFIDNMDRIDLLLLDVVMPKKSGKEALEEIKKTCPDVKALFISGYPEDTIRRKMNIDGKFTMIQKPIKPAELLAKIREMLVYKK